MSQVALSLQKVLNRISQTELNFNRPIGSVKLMVVTKGQNLANIRAVIAAGHTSLGENYLQEAIVKINALSDFSLDWHFIGNLQSNKTRVIAKNFSWVHSVNRFKIAQRLSQQRPKEMPPLNICLEVNINNEINKTGIPPEYVYELAFKIKNLPNLKLRGLMVIPKPIENFNQQLLLYKKVYNLQQELIEKGFDLDTLSMGMSNDFEAAIAAGSTIVRVGRAIFNNSP